MKRLILILFVVLAQNYALPSVDDYQGISNLWQITSSTSSDTQEKAALELIKRVVPERANQFEVKVDFDLLKPDNKDKFILQSVSNESVLITGTSGVSVANGFNHYLKRYLNCHISWSGNQLHIPDKLPVITTPVKVVIEDKFRYYENVCTVSYSMVWWDFGRWQQEIDWMALNAINFPLAFNGQELIWRKVFQKIGLTVEEVDDYFSGPAFLAWNRMGNIQRWSGPLTENWHKYQSVLQTNILKSMRSLGMIPILPAFAGHVPANITRVLPQAHVSKLSDWNGFGIDSRTSFLEPDDPHFIEIGASFVEEYSQHYGTDHFYNTDLFNEVTPESKDIKYLSDCGRAVYQSLAKSDPQAIWVMQGWLFENDPGYWTKERAKALVTGVPQGKLLILDLFSELYPQFTHLEGYWGQPFIWCMLHNFGGALGMYGAFNHLNKDVFESRKTYPNMVGIGLTPEGIFQNPIIYEFMTETTWYTSPVDLNKWVTDYAHRRYGYINDDLTRAWNLLQRSVYTDPIKVSNHGRYVINHRPSLNSQSVLWYNTSDLFNAFELFVNSSSIPQLQNSHTFQYDLIDITRQYLQLVFDIVYQKVVNSYKQKNQKDFDTNSKLLLDIMDDMDAILSTNDQFLLGKWIESARALGLTDQEKDYNEKQAKNQVTIWGPNGNILDYANKHWSGLFSHYYKPRWELFLQVLYTSLKNKTPYNQATFNKQVFDQVELKFVNDNTTFSTMSKGSAVKTSANIYTKYWHILGAEEDLSLHGYRLGNLGEGSDPLLTKRLIRF